jgi:PAS domain S-box-containing protein
MTSDEKTAYYTSLGLDHSELRAVMFLSIGLENACAAITDFSLVKHIVAMCPTTFTISSVLRCVSFFPTESRQLSKVFAMIASRYDLNIGQRFILYQTYRVKMNRQSSVSNDSNERVLVLKSKTDDLENTLRCFWTTNHETIAFCENYAEKVHALNALWEEAIRDYPNNPNVCYEFTRFLVDCATQFDTAVHTFNRGCSIENGQNLAIDYAFRSFVRAFPNYLRQKIVDTKGTITRITSTQSEENLLGNQSIHSGSMGALSHSDSFSITVDADMEEEISKQILVRGKLRNTLNNSLKGRETFGMAFMTSVSVILYSLVIVFFVVLYAVLDSLFQGRRSSMSRLLSLSNTRYYTNLAQISSFLRAAKHSRVFMFNESFYVSLNIGDTTTPVFDLVEIFTPQLMRYCVIVENSFTKLWDELAMLSSEGFNTYQIMEVMLADKVNMTFCNGIVPMKPVLTNLRNIVVNIIYNQLSLSTFSSHDWFHEQRLCELCKNFNAFLISADSLMESVFNNQKEAGDQLQSKLFIILIVLSIVTFIFVLFPPVFFSATFVFEVKGAMTALASVSRDAKENAMVPIFKNSKNEGSIETQDGVSEFLYYFIFWCFLALGVTAIAFFMIFVTYTSSYQMTTLNSWMLNAAQRLSAASGSAYKIMQVIVANGSTGDTFMEREALIQLAEQELEFLKRSNFELTMETKQSPACFGYDSEMDQINFEERCVIQTREANNHDLYRCASLNDLVSFYDGMATSILKRPTIEQGCIQSESAFQLLHLCFCHFFEPLLQTTERLRDLGELEYKQMIDRILILMIFGIILLVILMFVSAIVHNHATAIYSTVLVLIKHLSPQDIMKNKSVLDYILRRSESKKHSRMSLAQTIIHTASSGILGIGLNGFVEIINRSVSEILGYTKEQLLGQSFTQICTHETAEELLKQMGMMKSGQASRTYEDHLHLINSHDDTISAGIVVLGMGGEKRDTVTSFVIIFQDETSVIEAQKEAMEQKKKSENLLYQILPRDIVRRMNEGESDISFSVPSASIIFIDIIRFSEYAATLTPQEIMGNLSLVFNSFDAHCIKYPALTKIKLIGDVYMAAAGLFMKGENPTDHATQTVNFGFDALKSLEEVNVSLATNLCVRIGINSGGPILAGLLGKNNPAFDIIGDPINVAARLQSTSLEDRVQISVATKELVEHSGFEIIERGEIFLKGKGNQKTYFINLGSEIIKSFSLRDFSLH